VSHGIPGLPSDDLKARGSAVVGAQSARGRVSRERGRGGCSSEERPAAQRLRGRTTGDKKVGVGAGLWLRWIAALALGSAGCGGPGAYVWFDKYPPEPVNTEYTMSPGDVLNMRVFGHDDMTIKEKIRADGRIAVPLIGEVEAAGKHPSELRAELEARLKEYIVSPSLLVTIEESQPLTVVLLGEVTRPGTYALDPNGNLAQALAAAGGLTEFAARDSIYVVRRRPSPARIRFTYEAVSRNEQYAGAFRLHPEDLVVVE